ncbi:MAG: hypothetical protein AAFV88_00065 [Planctomycetota bacterium]
MRMPQLQFSLLAILLAATVCAGICFALLPEIRRREQIAEFKQRGGKVIYDKELRTFWKSESLCVVEPINKQEPLDDELISLFPNLTEVGLGEVKSRKGLCGEVRVEVDVYQQISTRHD